jgi:hypothetical protein
MVAVPNSDFNNIPAIFNIPRFFTGGGINRLVLASFFPMSLVWFQLDVAQLPAWPLLNPP